MKPKTALFAAIAAIGLTIQATAAPLTIVPAVRLIESEKVPAIEQ